MTVILTCSDAVQAMERENVTVKAETLDEAWKIAKKRFARKYKTKQEYVDITAVRRLEEV